MGKSCDLHGCKRVKMCSVCLCEEFEMLRGEISKIHSTLDRQERINDIALSVITTINKTHRPHKRTEDRLP